MPISKLRRIYNQLQDILDAAESRDIGEIKVSPNTYGLTNFIACGSYGFVDLDCDIDDLFEDEED